MVAVFSREAMNPRCLIYPEPGWLASPTPGRVVGTGLTAFLGLAIYGFTIGFWRDPLLGCNGPPNWLVRHAAGHGPRLPAIVPGPADLLRAGRVDPRSLAPVTFFLALKAPAPDSPNDDTAKRPWSGTKELTAKPQRGEDTQRMNCESVIKILPIRA